jgi:hypothetical protein
LKIEIGIIPVFVLETETKTETARSETETETKTGRSETETETGTGILETETETKTIKNRSREVSRPRPGLETNITASNHISIDYSCDVTWTETPKYLSTRTITETRLITLALKLSFSARKDVLVKCN